jgi:hypothetical protein
MRRSMRVSGIPGIRFLLAAAMAASLVYGQNQTPPNAPPPAARPASAQPQPSETAAAVCSAPGVVVRIAPPAAIDESESRSLRPGEGYVWIIGYHCWTSNGYAWVPGRWTLPPRPHARFVSYRWVSQRGGWVLEGGRWR